MLDYPRYSSSVSVSESVSSRLPFAEERVHVRVVVEEFAHPRDGGLVTGSTASHHVLGAFDGRQRVRLHEEDGDALPLGLADDGTRRAEPAGQNQTLHAGCFQRDGLQVGPVATRDEGGVPRPTQVTKRLVAAHRADEEPFDELVRVRIREEFGVEFRREVADSDAREVLLSRDDAENGDSLAFEERHHVRVERVEVRVRDGVEQHAGQSVADVVHGGEEAVDVARRSRSPR